MGASFNDLACEVECAHGVAMRKRKSYSLLSVALNIYVGVRRRLSYYPFVASIRLAWHLSESDRDF